MSIDQAAFCQITYGLYLVSAFYDGKPNALIVNSAIQTTAEPPSFSITVNKKSLTCEFIKASRKFCLQPISQRAEMLFIGNFGFRTGRTFNKFEKYYYGFTDDGFPFVTQNTLSYITVNVEKEEDLGTHIMFIGKVSQSKILARGAPLTYEYYHQVLKGKTHKDAPTYQDS